MYNFFYVNIYFGSFWCDLTLPVHNKITVNYNNSFRILLKLSKYWSASEIFVLKYLFFLTVIILMTVIIVVQYNIHMFVIHIT